MARPVDVKPWSDLEIAELATIAPRKYGAVSAFAAKHARSHPAVSSKLLRLRLQGIARDTAHARTPRNLLTQRGRSL